MGNSFDSCWYTAEERLKRQTRALERAQRQNTRKTHIANREIDHLEKEREKYAKQGKYWEVGNVESQIESKRAIVASNQMLGNSLAIGTYAVNQTGVALQINDTVQTTAHVIHSIHGTSDQQKLDARVDKFKQELQGSMEHRNKTEAVMSELQQQMLEPTKPRVSTDEEQRQLDALKAVLDSADPPPDDDDLDRRLARLQGSN